MNHSLLIVICDFLLLSMLALARFDKAAPLDPNARAAMATPVSQAVQSDVVDSLRDSLKGEEAARVELSKSLEERAKVLEAERSRSETLEEEKNRLQGEADRLERLSGELEEKRSSLAGQYQLSQQERDRLRDEVVAAQARERLMQQQMEATQNELLTARGNIATLQEEKARVERESAVLATRLEGAAQSQQKLEGEMATLREEKNAASRSAETLARNVGELAEVHQATGEAIRKEIRDTTHLSINEVFTLFRKSRAVVRASIRTKILLGEVDASFEKYAVFAKDAQGGVYAMAEVGHTALKRQSLSSLRAASATMLLPGMKSFEAESVLFLSSDSRVALFPVPAPLAGDAAVRPFEIEENPLRFPTAVVVTTGGEKYGEAPIRVIPGNGSYVEVQTSFANVLFGSFVPSEGDLVFSLNGKLIGFMVASDRAVVLKKVTGGGRLPLGGAFDAGRAAALGAALAEGAPSDAE
jgi:hypothetical protein